MTRKLATVVLAGCASVLLIAGCAAPAPTGAGTTSSGPASAAHGSALAGSPTASVAASSNPVAGSSESPPVQPTVDTRQPRPTSPTLFLSDQGALLEQPPQPGALTLSGSGGQTRDGDPYQPIVFTGSDLWLDYTDGTASFAIPVDAAENIGSGTQLRISADLTGDGTWDRVETFKYFATDPLPGTEPYTDAIGILDSEGEWGDLRGGIVQVEIWSTLGDSGSTIELGDASTIHLPYS